MPASTWSFVLSGAIVLMLTSVAHAQRLVSIDDKPVCGACRVTVNPVHTLAGNDSIALSRFSRAVIAGTSYIVTPTYTPAQIVVFDSAGQLQKVFGRRGRGPREMYGGNTLKLAAGPGDSLHVVDQNRWLVFAPRTYEFVRSVNLPATPTLALILDSGLMLAAFGLPSPNAQPITAGLIDATGRMVRSFDPPDRDRRREPWSRIRTIDAAAGAVWTAHVNSITIRRESLSSGEVTMWQRKEGWFTSWTGDNLREPYLDPPRPRLAAVRSDGSTLWLHMQQADADWSPLRELEPPRGSEGMRRPTHVDPDRFFDGVIEAIDMASGNVIARLTTREVWHPVIGRSDLVQRTRALESGEIALDIARLRLERR